MKSGAIHSITPVFKELIKGNDELKTWISKYKNTSCFLKVDDEATQMAYREIINWVYSPNSQFKEPAKNEFLSVADSWLIAKAISTNCSIVTLEKFDPNIKKKIKISNVCKIFDVAYIRKFSTYRSVKINEAIKNINILWFLTVGYFYIM